MEHDAKALIKEGYSMKQFRLPRKIKKALKGNFWLYPADANGNSRMAFPIRSQADYTAIKNGVVRNLMDPAKAKERRKKFREDLNKEIIVPDDELKRYVDDIIREDLRNSSYNTLLSAKNNSKAVKAYHNFVNAYQLTEAGTESYGNICCLSIDLAEKLLKDQKKKTGKK